MYHKDQSYECVIFRVCINDLSEKVTPLTHLFTDDSVLYCLITSSAEQTSLQEDSLEVEQLESQLDIQDFYPDKHNTLLVTKSRTPVAWTDTSVATTA